MSAVSKNASTLTAVGKGMRLTEDAVKAVIASAGDTFDWTMPTAVADALNAWIKSTEGRLPARTATRTANGHPVKRDGSRAYRVGEVMPDGTRCAKSEQAAQDSTDYGRGYDRVRKAVAAQVRTPAKPAAGIRVIITDADGATRSLSVEAGSELATAILAALPPAE